MLKYGLKKVVWKIWIERPGGLVAPGCLMMARYAFLFLLRMSFSMYNYLMIPFIRSTEFWGEIP